MCHASLACRSLARPTLPGLQPSVQTDLVRRLSSTAAALLLLMLLGACSTSGHSFQPGGPAGPVPTASAASRASPDAAAVAGRATDWLQYHGNAARSGNVPGLPAAGRLAVAWSRPLGGAVYGQPLVVGTTVIAATESDEVYGLQLVTGAVLWHTRVGSPLPLGQQPCGNVDPLGITSTPVYDAQTRLVYIVAQSGTSEHLLVGLRPSDGRIVVRQNVPSPDGKPAYDQQRGALALADQHIYVAFGGHFGDCGPYIGSVVAMPASGRGPIWSYRVPTSKQGGIWAAAGPVVGPSGTIYVSAGNGGSVAPPYDGSDSVIALTPQLHRIGVFAPPNWATLSADDLDLGSMSPAVLGDDRILQVGKSGVAYLLNATHLGGVGGQLGQQPVCVAFGGAAVSGTVVYVPCWDSGLTAVDTAGNRITIRWRSPAAVWGSPVLGGGAVWVAQPGNGTLYELSPATGRVRQELKLAGRLPDFVSPSLSGRLVLIGTMSGVTAVSGA
jgi:outer membrane protein assembly factor BamB